MSGTVTTQRACSCAHNGDGSVTTMLCPAHATQDPCATMAAVTGRRRRGSIVRGACTHCGWHAAPADGDDDASRIVRACRAGLITRDEMAIELAALHGIDIRCFMGECTHVPEMAR